MDRSVGRAALAARWLTQGKGVVTLIVEGSTVFVDGKPFDNQLFKATIEESMEKLALHVAAGLCLAKAVMVERGLATYLIFDNGSYWVRCGP